MGNRLRSSLLGHPAPSKWVRLRSSMVESLDRYPDGEPVGVSGLNCTMPNGTTVALVACGCGSAGQGTDGPPATEEQRALGARPRLRGARGRKHHRHPTGWSGTG